MYNYSQPIIWVNGEEGAKAYMVSPSDLDYVDKLTHAIKSVETTKAMLSATKEEEHHPDEKMLTELKSMMNGVTDEHTLTEFQRFINSIESK